MKNIFGLDLSDKKDEKEIEIDGAVFITKRISEHWKEETETLLEGLEDITKRLSLPPAFRILKAAAGVAAVLVGIGLLKGLMSVSLQEAYHNAPVLFWMEPGFVLTYLILWFWGKRREKAVEGDEQVRLFLNGVPGMEEEQKRELGVPGNAKKADVLTFLYERKRGKVKSVFGWNAGYSNEEWYVYRREDCLCFSDTAVEVSIPVSMIGKEEVINKKVSMTDWNKEEGIRSYQYKPYKITENNGIYYIRSYCRFPVDNGREEFEFLIPDYDAGVIESLLR